MVYSDDEIYSEWRWRHCVSYMAEQAWVGCVLEWGWIPCREPGTHAMRSFWSPRWYGLRFTYRGETETRNQGPVFYVYSLANLKQTPKYPAAGSGHGKVTRFIIISMNSWCFLFLVVIFYKVRTVTMLVLHGEIQEPCYIVYIKQSVHDCLVCISV